MNAVNNWAPRRAPYPTLWAPPRAGWVGVGADDDEYDNTPIWGGIRQALGHLPNLLQSVTEDDETRRRRWAEEEAQRQADLQRQGRTAPQAQQQVHNEREFTPNPQRWLEERAQDLTQNPVLGTLRAISGPWEALGTAATYAGGVAGAGFQAGAERYGWNPSYRLGEIAQESDERPWSGIPIIGGPLRAAEIAGRTGLEAAGTLGGTARDLLTGGVPDARGSMAGMVPWPTEGTAIPSIDNPFDPTEAMQRARAMFGPAEAGLHIAGGMVSAGAYGSILQGVGGQLGRATGLGATGLEALGQNTLASALASPLGGRVLPVAAAGLAGAIAPLRLQSQEGSEPEPWERLLSAVEAGGGVLGLNMAARRLEAAGAAAARGYTRWADPDAVSATTKAVTEEMQGGRARLRGILTPELPPPGEPTAAYYGGPVREFVDRFSTWVLNPLESLSTLSAAKGLNRGDIANDPARLMDLARGADARVAQALKEHVYGPMSMHVNNGNVTELEDYWGLLMMRDKAAKGMQSGKHIKTVDDAENTIRERLQNYAKLFPTDAQKVVEDPQAHLWRQTGFGEVIQRFQDASNLVMRDMEDSGMLKTGMAQRLADEWGRYGFLEDGDTFFKSIGAKQYKPNDLVMGRGIGEAHDSTITPSLTLEGQTKKLQQGAVLAARNRAMNALAAVADDADHVGPTELKHAPLKPKTIRVEDPDNPGKYMDQVIMAPTDDVPRGFSRIPYFIKDAEDPSRNGTYAELHAAGLLGEALSGANTQDPNFLTKTLSIGVGMFRNLVTAWSPQFWPAHFVRQVQELYEKAPAGTFAMNNMGNVMGHTVGATYEAITDGFEAWARTHPGAAQTMANQIGESGDRWIRNAPHFGNFFEPVNPERIAHGGANADLMGIYRAKVTQQMLGVQRTGPLAGVQDMASDTAQLGSWITKFADDVPRILTYRLTKEQALKAGKPLEEAMDLASWTARTFTNDYSRQGTIVKLANSFTPLLNARLQGWSNTMGGVVEAPSKVFGRMSVVAALTANTEAINRQYYGDLWDDVPAHEKDIYWHLPWGYWDDANGKSHPQTFRIVKSPFYMMIATPVQHLMDAVYHTKAADQNLTGDQRTGRSAQELWLTEIGLATPQHLPGGVLKDWQALALSALSLNPMTAMASEMIANRSYFTGRPILSPDQAMLPPQYQYERGSSALSKKLGQVTGVGPVYWDSAVNHIFGTAGRIAGAFSDIALKSMQDNGLVDGDPFAPTSVADLKLPEGLSEGKKLQYLDEIGRVDPRNPMNKFLLRFFGQTGGAQSVLQRAQEAGPQELKQWRATLDLDERGRQLQVEYGQRYSELFARTDLSHFEMRKLQNDLAVGYRHALAEAKNEALSNGAITTPGERKAFVEHLPSYDPKAFVQTLPNLPAGVGPAQLDALLERYKTPPGVDPGLQAQNPLRWAEAKRQELGNIGRELGLAPNVVYDHLAAHTLGKTLPGLPVPATYVDEMVAHYRAPLKNGMTGPELDPLTTRPSEWATAQRSVTSHFAAQWGVPEGQVLEWANSRMLSPDAPPGERSRRNGAALEQVMNDPTHFPRYATHDGQPLDGSGPDQWEAYDRTLDEVRNRYAGRPRSAWPGWARTLDNGRRYAEAAQYQWLQQQPDFGDWERWYGTGRGSTAGEWEQFTSGAVPRYKADITPQQALAWDAIYQTYRRLPDGPDKARLRPFAQRIHRAAIPRWKALIDRGGDVARNFADTTGD